MSFVVLTPEQLTSLIADAVAQGVEQGLMRAKPLLMAEEAISQEEAMKLAAYSDKDSFRRWCKANRIEPVVKARKNFYLPSQLRQAATPKGLHR